MSYLNLANIVSKNLHGKEIINQIIFIFKNICLNITIKMRKNVWQVCEKLHKVVFYNVHQIYIPT